jgi:YidC/Oxa1 family membrane protein insertase
MDINKRSILWIVFAVSLVILWNNWMISTGKPSMFAPAPAKPVVASASAAAAGTPAAAAASAAAVAAVPGAPAPIKTEVVTITTDVMRVDIDTLGGTIKHLELLKHKAAGDPGWLGGCFGLFEFCKPKGGQNTEVLFSEQGKHIYLGLTGLVGAPNLPNHQTPFVAKPGARMLNDADKVQLVLEAEQGGVKLTKTFVFKKGDYVVDVQHAVTNTSAAPLAPQLYLQLKHDGTPPEGSGFMNPSFIAPTFFTSENQYKKYEFKTIEKDAEKQADNPFKPVNHVTNSKDGWVAISQHFFVSAFVPQEGLVRDIFTKKEGDNLYSIGVVQPLGSLAPGATVTNNARLYSGPQETETLKKVTEGLDLVKDYGFLAIVARPMWAAMAAIHSVVGNWGWTIIAFTVAIKLLFFPLSAASFRSMAKMKTVTPKMTAIRERHKGDPQKMNQAMMELYKTEKINPLGGCLPILVQMPVFIALYWVLNASVEMRGAPWALWITDLTQHDPWAILPILYAISMYITTRLNPQPADPVQAKMMMFMPIAFSVMFFFFPSGLVLYWVVNNLLSIAQQWVITKKLEVGTAK